MIKDIDFSSLKDQLDDALQYEAVVDYTLTKLTSLVADRWYDEANNGIKDPELKKQYLSSIEADDRGPYLKGIVLRNTGGWAVNALESGASPFDMKPGFAASQKRKIKEDGGWHLTIPKRHGTEGTVSFSSVVPAAVVKALPSLPDQYKIKTVRQRIYDGDKLLYDAYESKNAMFDGLTKIKRLGGGHTYATFRRVSDKSDPLSWVHPGLVARNFLDKALDGINFNEELNDFANEFLNA